MGEYSPRPRALQLLIGLGGVALGAYCVKAAYYVGAAADTWIGIALAALVIVSWGMLPWADVRGKEGAWREALVWRVAWIGVLAVVVANGVSYSAHYRVEQTGDAEGRIEAYEDAKTNLARGNGLAAGAGLGGGDLADLAGLAFAFLSGTRAATAAPASAFPRVLARTFTLLRSFYADALGA